MTPNTIYLLTPEIVLIAAAVTIYVGGAFSSSQTAWRWIAGAAMLLAAAALATQHGPSGLSGPLNFDALSWNVRWLAIAVGAAFTLIVSRPPTDTGASEYTGSMLLTIAGLMLVAAAANLVLLFVALELISIPTYVLLYLGRRDSSSQEATVKYFFLSILSSAILLYGFSFFYGVAGSTHFATASRSIQDTAGGLQFGALSKVAIALVLAGLCFRVTAVPFHFYAPDVYQGTTHPNAALLSVVPKAAGLVVMVRLLLATMPGVEAYTWHAVAIVSAITMTWGNVLALWQDDLRRLLAYSSIANAGYMLIGVAVALATQNQAGPWNGMAATGFYFVAYSAATIGAFALLQHLGRPGRRIDAVEELAGVGRTRPAAAALLAVCMFSLAGAWPMAGFWGKLLVFGSALNVGGMAGADRALWWWFTALAVLGVLNAAIAAAYYLRVVAVMYFRTPLAMPRAQGGMGAWWVAIACTAVVLAAGIFPGPLIRASTDASAGLPALSIDRADRGANTVDLAADHKDSHAIGRTLLAGERPPHQSAP